MYKYSYIFLSLYLLIGNTTSNPLRQNVNDQNEFNLFDPNFWTSLLDDYFSDSDDKSSSVHDENIRPVVVCSPPNCTIVINVQNGHHTGNVNPNDTIHPGGSLPASPANLPPTHIYGDVLPHGSDHHNGEKTAEHHEASGPEHVASPANVVAHTGA